jgi:hypothetical protein
MVGVNTGKLSAGESPFGGIKENGYGGRAANMDWANTRLLKQLQLVTAIYYRKAARQMTGPPSNT